MKKRTSLLLATIAISLSIVTFAASRRETTSRLRIESAITIPFKNIEQIQIYHGSVMHASFRTSNGKDWSVTSELLGVQKDTADKVALGDLLKMVHSMRTRPAENVSLAEAKLENLNEAIQVVVQSINDKTESIYLGAATPDGKDRYFLMGSDPDTVHVADNQITRVVDRPVAHLRSWDLFELGVEGPEQIRIEHAGQGVTMDRVVGGWAIIQPIRWPADTNTVLQVVQACAALRALSFAPAALTPQEAGINGQSPSITLVQKGTPQTVRFGDVSADGNGVYAMRQGRPNIYVVPKELPSLCLDPKSEIFRLRMLQLFAPGQLASLEIDKEGESLLLQKQGARWVASGARSFPVDQDMLKQVGGVLQQIRIVDLPTGKEAEQAAEELTKPAVTIRGADAGGGRLFSLVIGAVHQDGTAYGRIAGRDAIVRLDPLQALALQSPFVVFRDRNIKQLAWDEMDTLEIVRPTGRIVFKYSGGTRFRIIEPKLQQLSQAKIFDLLFIVQKLARLKAVGYELENPTNLSEFGLDRPLAHVVLRVESSSGTESPIGVNLLIGRAKDVQVAPNKRERFYFARLADERPIFTIKSDLVNRLLAPYP